MIAMTECPWCFGSHACDLPFGHEGNHRCLKWETGETCFEWEPGHQFEFECRSPS